MPIKEKLKQYILDNIEIINESVVLVFIEETVHKMDMYKSLESISKIIELKELKPIEIKTRLSKICSLYKVRVQDKNLDYLLEISGTNMQDLMNEIRKLIEYAGENGEIQKEDLDENMLNTLKDVLFS